MVDDFEGSKQYPGSEQSPYIKSFLIYNTNVLR